MRDWTKIEAYRRGAAYQYLRTRLTHGRVFPKMKLPSAQELLAEAYAAAGLTPPSKSGSLTP